MREIKFRAWLRSESKYVHTDDWEDLGLWGWHSFLNRLGEERGYTPVLEQYTGLKDKNGVEIYEGDVLAPRNTKTGEAGHIWVEYNETAAAFVVVGIKDGERLEASLGEWFQEMPDMERDGIEAGHRVIGNIHENPELLEPEGGK